jgi:hypothetical protein
MLVDGLKSRFPNHSFELRMHGNPFAGSYGYPSNNHYPYLLVDGNILKDNIFANIEDIDKAEEIALERAIKDVELITKHFGLTDIEMDDLRHGRDISMLHMKFNRIRQLK